MRPDARDVTPELSGEAESAAADMRAPAPLVMLRSAGVAFGAVQALQPTTLVLHRHESLVLVGANGSGKTSLLRLLHGVVPHSGARSVQVLACGRAPVIATGSTTAGCRS